MQKHTPKHFVIQLGALIALYVAITALIVLLFSIINLKFPDEVASYWESQSARDAIRTTMAILIVFFPTYLYLTRFSNQTRRKELSGEYTNTGRWLVYVSLLIAAGVLLANLVTLIIFFLNGEITTRFLWKVAALFLVVGAAFHYYVLDVRGYFTKRVEKSLMFGVGATVLVISSLMFGYQFIETPSEVRELRFDEQQVMDLQGMQSYVEQYYYRTNELPTDLATAYDRLPLPEAPTGRASYTYEVTGERTYELCATFAADSQNRDEFSFAPDPNYNWSHLAGEWCFERAVTPADVKPID